MWILYRFQNILGTFVKKFDLKILLQTFYFTGCHFLFITESKDFSRAVFKIYGKSYGAGHLRAGFFEEKCKLIKAVSKAMSLTCSKFA